MRLPEFEYAEPQSVAEVCALLGEDPEGSTVMAGGTDVLVNLKEGFADHRRLVSLRGVPELGRIETSEARGLVIGAMATVNQVARHDAIRAHYPGLVDAARSLAADQVRNLATVAGNLCSAIPSADMAPILLAHDAQLRVVSTAGERVVRLREFFTGPGTTVLQPGEVVVAVEVPAPKPGTGDASLRQGGRATLSLPLASAAAVVRMEGELCREVSLALGAVAPTPIVTASVAELVAGKKLTASLLEQAGELASAATRPIDDLRSTKEYRLELVKVLARRALGRAAERTK
ncbi:MAG: xanthine dehydrogenase family protein subunit M [bacterium]|nr:xanthine dehydrogenase family protein subunit M [bacterium]